MYPNPRVHLICNLHAYKEQAKSRSIEGIQVKRSREARNEILPRMTNWPVWMNNSEVSLWTFKISHIIPTKNNSLVVSKVSCDRVISKKSTAWLPGIYREENC